MAAVDELREELVELLQALIRIPTLNPPGEAYEDFVTELRARLDGYGYTTEFELERDLRDSISTTLYSGTSEIQRNIIARYLGL